MISNGQLKSQNFSDEKKPLRVQTFCHFRYKSRNNKCLQKLDCQALGESFDSSEDFAEPTVETSRNCKVLKYLKWKILHQNFIKKTYITMHFFRRILLLNSLSYKSRTLYFFEFLYSYNLTR